MSWCTFDIFVFIPFSCLIKIDFSIISDVSDFSNLSFPIWCISTRIGTFFLLEISYLATEITEVWIIDKSELSTSEHKTVFAISWKYPRLSQSKDLLAPFTLFNRVMNYLFTPYAVVSWVNFILCFIYLNTYLMYNSYCFLYLGFNLHSIVCPEYTHLPHCVSI